MRDLRDDLKSLGEEKYNVPLDFSKSVMHKINKEKRYTKLKNMASFGIAACIAVFSVFTINKLGVLDRVKEAINKSKIVNSFEENVQTEDTTNDLEEVTTNESEPELMEESLASEITSSTETLDAPILEDNSKLRAKELAAPSSTDGIVNGVSEEAQYDLLESKATNINRTYSKQMVKQDYLNEIFELIKKAGYKVELNLEASQIVVQSSDFNAVSKLVEVYIDSQIAISGDSIIISVE